MTWLPKILPKSCKIILSCDTDSEVNKTLSTRPDTAVLCMPKLNDRIVRSEIIKRNLSLHHKSVTNAQLEVLVTSQLSWLPLYLATVVNELRMFGCYEQLDAYIAKYTAVTSLKELWRLIVCRWITEYSKTTASPVTETVEGKHINHEILGKRVLT